MTLAKKTLPPAPLAVEDDERHSADVDGFIERNRDALNASLRRARAEGASEASVAQVIVAGRRRRSSQG